MYHAHQDLKPVKTTSGSAPASWSAYNWEALWSAIKYALRVICLSSLYQYLVLPETETVLVNPIYPDLH